MRRMLLTAVVAMLAFASVHADVYFVFDNSGLTFNYARNSNAAVAGAVIGSISINENANSKITGYKWNSGADGVVDNGTNDDVLLAAVDVNKTDFDLGMVADVIYLADGVYKVATTSSLYSTDSIANGGGLTKNYEAEMKNGSAALAVIPTIGSAFSVTGTLSTVAGNDAILVPSASGATWDFFGSTAGDQIGLNGAEGARQNYDVGLILDFHFGEAVASLDSFFFKGTPGTGTRTSQVADMKVTIVPLPGAVLLGAMGLGLVGWVKRRFA